MTKYRITIYYDCTTIMDRFAISSKDFFRIIDDFEKKGTIHYDHELTLDNCYYYIRNYCDNGYKVLLTSIIDGV